MSALEVAIALDQLANTFLGGYADETMSARCWRLRKEQPYTALRPIVDGIFFWQFAHCESSYQSEVLRSQLPGEYSPAEACRFVDGELRAAYNRIHLNLKGSTMDLPITPVTQDSGHGDPPPKKPPPLDVVESTDDTVEGGDK